MQNNLRRGDKKKKVTTLSVSTKEEQIRLQGNAMAEIISRGNRTLHYQLTRPDREKCCSLKARRFLHGPAAIFHGTSTDIM